MVSFGMTIILLTLLNDWYDKRMEYIRILSTLEFVRHHVNELEFGDVRKLCQQEIGEIQDVVWRFEGILECQRRRKI